MSRSGRRISFLFFFSMNWSANTTQRRIAVLSLKHKMLELGESFWNMCSEAPNEGEEKSFVSDLTSQHTAVSVHGCCNWYKKMAYQTAYVKFASFFHQSYHSIDGICLSVAMICRAKVIIMYKSRAIET